MESCYNCIEHRAHDIDGLCQNCRRVKAQDDAFEIQLALGQYFIRLEQMAQIQDDIGFNNAISFLETSLRDVTVKHAVIAQRMRELIAS